MDKRRDNSRLLGSSYSVNSSLSSDTSAPSKSSDKLMTDAKLLPSVLPATWQGETNCAVGPFSSHAVAEYFAGNVVDFGQLETVARRVFVKRDAWYVEVRATQTANVKASKLGKPEL